MVKSGSLLRGMDNVVTIRGRDAVWRRMPPMVRESQKGSERLAAVMVR